MMLLEEEVRILSSCIAITPILAASVQKESAQAGSALGLPRVLQEMAGAASRGWRAAGPAHAALLV